MSIIVECPSCRARSHAPVTAAGSKGKCRNCGAVVVVPGGRSNNTCVACGAGVTLGRGRRVRGHYYCARCTANQNAFDEPDLTDLNALAAGAVSAGAELLRCPMCGLSFSYAQMDPSGVCRKCARSHGRAGGIVRKPVLLGAAIAALLLIAFVVFRIAGRSSPAIAEASNRMAPVDRPSTVTAVTPSAEVEQGHSPITLSPATATSAPSAKHQPADKVPPPAKAPVTQDGATGHEVTRQLIVEFCKLRAESDAQTATARRMLAESKAHQAAGRLEQVSQAMESARAANDAAKSSLGRQREISDRLRVLPRSQVYAARDQLLTDAKTPAEIRPTLLLVSFPDPEDGLAVKQTVKLLTDLVFAIDAAGSQQVDEVRDLLEGLKRQNRFLVAKGIDAVLQRPDTSAAVKEHLSTLWGELAGVDSGARISGTITKAEAAARRDTQPENRDSARDKSLTDAKSGDEADQLTDEQLEEYRATWIRGWTKTLADARRDITKLHSKSPERKALADQIRSGDAEKKRVEKASREELRRMLRAAFAESDAKRQAAEAEARRPTVVCPSCGGSGRRSAEDMQQEAYSRINSGQGGRVTNVCARCRGTGRVKQ